MPPLRIGFIGAGANTRDRHIPGFRSIDGVELAAVANRTRESGQAVAAQFGIARVFDSPEDLVADPSIDAVCIGTWPYRHREYTSLALAAGKHVLCEARMAMDQAEAADMLAAAQRRPGLVAQLVPAPFDLRSGATITRLVREGAIGDITEVSVAALNGSGLNPSVPIHWRNRMLYSGRNIGSLGIWAEVIQRWLGEARTVSGHGTIFVGQRPDPETGGMAPVDIPDSVTVTGSLAIDARYTYRVSVVAGHASDNGIVIYGTKGTIRWFPNDTAEIAMAGGTFEPVTADPGTDRGWRVESDFVESIRTGAPVRLTSFADGMRYMKFVDAAWRSIHEGNTIALD